MTKLKMLAVATVAAAAICVAGLVGTPTASAAPKYTCGQAHALASAYYTSGDILAGYGYYALAYYYYGLAEGIVDASC